MGNLQIPRENLPEWERLNNQAHELIVGGKDVPRDVRVRMYVLEGMAQPDAELLANSPDGCECGDTRGT